ncbi:glycosyltransferase family 4 protein [Mycolicibacterium psychrotolerans]|uniref:glycosyltransferase family 4 protein n=1 Tax=Mycolicibacterium psychrotolerans TaxID=216929 RepID=UPI0027E3B088|nr:glycosyltransferase family 4 protein [Mycolicibacterium psychrotolerans]
MALVSAVDPFPADAGKKVVIAGFLEYLADRVGRENVHYLVVDGSDKAGFPGKVHPLPKPRATAALARVVLRCGTGQASLQESLLSTAGVARAIHRTLESVSADTEIYDTVRMAQHAESGGTARQICYLDDLFSERYRGMLAAAEQYPDVEFEPLGNFATYVPRQVRPLADNAHSQRLLLRIERHLVQVSEDRAARNFGTTLLMNEQEAGVLRRRCGGSAHHVRSIPPLINRVQNRREYRGAPEFVFLGLLSLPHNDDGLRSFLAHVWPRVLAASPDARLRVVGRYPRPKLVNLVGSYPDSVVFEGFVPDLGRLLGRAAAMVNPLRFGSGVKLKIIEALGAGLPVISTTIGADGVHSGPGTGVMVADGDAEFADLLLEATVPTNNADLSAAASEHFEQRYSRTAVFTEYDAAFGLG